MEVVHMPGYTEEIPLLTKPAQFIVIAHKAAAHLQWHVAALNANTIQYQAPGDGYSGGELITIVIDQASAVFHSRSVGSFYPEETQNAKNAALFKEALAWVAAEEEKANRNLHPMHREPYGALIPSKSYVVTPVIVYANALVFIAMVLAGLSPLSPTAQSLFLWGGNFRRAVTGGDWWRLITYMFLHAGFMHLLLNTFALLYIGMFLEPLLGRFRFASAYLLSGVCAGLASIFMHPASVGVGASGAIFGMYGVFLSMLTTSHIQKTMRKTMLRSILFFVVFNLMTGLQGNTDNAAHIGGLLSGLAIGYAYYPGIARHAPLRRQLLVTGILAAIVAGIAVVAIPCLVL